MILFSHPTGCTMARQSLRAIYEAGLLNRFFTSFGISYHSSLFFLPLPKSLKKELARRAYGVPRKCMRTSPYRELCRLLSTRLDLPSLIKHETGPFSLDKVCEHHDRRVARYLQHRGIRKRIQMIYGYEDSCFRSFESARERGIHCFYELPIAYWSFSQKMLREEVERYPEWEPTLLGNRDSEEKLERKSLEIHLADTILCPSHFVARTLPEDVLRKNAHVIIPYGCPKYLPISSKNLPIRSKNKLKVLFAGSMTQRKGLADLFKAMTLLNRNDVELTVFGAPLMNIRTYRTFYSNFIYEPPRSNKEVLRLMQQCDVLVLPSIVEGRAIVQLEALACGLPIIVTPNAGGEDLIDEGKTGFLIPIRSPEAIAEKINWLADHKDLLPDIKNYCQTKAQDHTWEVFRRGVVEECQKIKEQAGRR